MELNWKSGIVYTYDAIAVSKGITIKFDSTIQPSNKKLAIYHEATGKSSGAREAKWFIECCNEYTKQDNIILALYWNVKMIAKAKVVPYIKEFLDTVKELTGKIPVLNITDDYIEAFDWTDVADSYSILRISEDNVEDVAPIIIKNKAPSDPVYYKVRSRDTLVKLAMQYNTTVKDIKELNPDVKKTSKIYPGQRIRVK